jgi:3-methyladenine DNA glycosylase AlkD
VRTPALRKLAKELAKEPDTQTFLSTLPHEYLEENNLHAFLISETKDFGSAVAAVDAFLPYVDNWATCDQMSPKTFGKHPGELLPYIRRWLSDGRTYTVRFGTEMLMTHYLGSEFSPLYPELVARIRSDEYYVNMMTAWYFATALAKRWDDVIPFIEQKRLDRWTHNKAIQKATESFRITDEQKAYLRTLKIK